MLFLLFPSGKSLYGEEPLEGFFSKTSFSYYISPTSSGSIDGGLNAAVRWTDWLESRVELSSMSLSEKLDRDTVSGNVSSTNQSLAFEGLSINQEALWGLLGWRHDPFSLKVGAAGKLAKIISAEQGYSASPTVTFYMEERTITYIRPLVNVEAGYQIGGLLLQGSGSFTPPITEDASTGTIVTNQNPTEKAYSAKGLGFDGRYSASLKIRFLDIAPKIAVDYSIHSGVTQTNRSGSADTIVIQKIDIATSASLALHFMKTALGAPSIGVSWIRSSEETVQRPELSFSNDRVRFDLGFSY